jgi:thioredoxin reductase
VSPAAARDHVDVLVIGAGPAGLAAARALALAGVRNVRVVDREQHAGGVPRHCHHNGFGIRDLHRAMSGPRYAEELVKRALAAGVRIETETMVTGWPEPGVVSLTSPSGVRLASAEAVVLATGARERPRSARLVPGDRPAGVFTTGELQQSTHAHHLSIGQRAIVVGAEHVSYSAVLTLRAAGVRTVAMVTDLARHQSYAGFAAGTRWGLHVPLWTSTEVTAIRGRGRVAGVDLRDRSTGNERSVAVDTVVFTGDWIADHELARSAGLAVDRVSTGPVVDADGQSSADRIFAAGNLAHPGETADIAALRGQAVGAALARQLRSGGGLSRPAAIDIEVEPPLRWSSPGRVVAGRAAGLPHGLILHTAEFAHRATVAVTQDDRALAQFTVRRAGPHRSIRVPLDWTTSVDPDGGPIRVRV